ncbi:hypothetical protein CONPUDRAFT_131111 [Coniophora puteana RWD-64-598 SS2]|uniref:tripeptidyl-peptidase II n=1 Tax=Coniophora puteana (strain RWD-64-598) TaxID=741705 RepID=A0A5M3MD31_CONPW|nr:uncharacterized protein CONPUDRAFT_131111 [Coniophora puteana RWD-64-598 SS2]EIW76535.1 hypothetical protein CONPUDRAFT_131111 [Coniophora puteana RWD-64-598 SS2]
MHLSKEEVHALMAPTQDTHEVVNEWLASHGLDESSLVRSSIKDWVSFLVPVSLAEEMFDTHFHVYKHDQSAEAVIRTTSYSLPEVLHAHIDLVHPMIMYTSPKPFRSALHFAGGERRDVDVMATTTGTVTSPSGNTVNASCKSTITPDCLRQLYNVGNYTSSASNGNSIAVTAYIQEYANFADYQQFLRAQAPDAAGSNFSVISIAGGQNNQTLNQSGEEAALDIDYAFSLAHPIPSTFYTVGGTPTGINWTLPILEFIDYVLNQTDIPQVISTSYGQPEDTVPFSYANKVCQGFAALGARGVSVLFASGDYGVGLCEANATNPQFQPQWPATCPYVTSVGATQDIPEVAWQYSGGGFSSYYPRPPYQDEAAQAFLSQVGSAYEGQYNSSGRGHPDISAQGVNYLIIKGGNVTSASGTSASSPVVAALVAMLNDARIKAGMSTLGFLNPLLYSQGASALNDITKGSNPGCGTPGFNATKGWDPVTGLGTPDFSRLKDLVLSSNISLSD